MCKHTLHSEVCPLSIRIYMYIHAHTVPHKNGFDITDTVTVTDSLFINTSYKKAHALEEKYVEYPPNTIRLSMSSRGSNAFQENSVKSVKSVFSVMRDAIKDSSHDTDY